MIALLTGRLAFKAPSHVTLDVHGVGYEVLIPLSTYYSLPNQQELVTLSIHTHVREDAIQLYGFMTTAEKEAFLSADRDFRNRAKTGSQRLLYAVGPRPLRSHSGG